MVMMKPTAIDVKKEVAIDRVASRRSCERTVIAVTALTNKEVGNIYGRRKGTGVKIGSNRRINANIIDMIRGADFKSFGVTRVIVAAVCHPENARK